jgi:hypothetical protein
MARWPGHHDPARFASAKRTPRDQTWHHIFSAGLAQGAEIPMKSEPRDREVAFNCPTWAKHKLIVEQQVTNQVLDMGLLTQTAEPAKEVLGVETIDVVAEFKF